MVASSSSPHSAALFGVVERTLEVQLTWKIKVIFAIAWALTESILIVFHLGSCQIHHRLWRRIHLCPWPLPVMPDYNCQILVDLLGGRDSTSEKRCGPRSSEESTCDTLSLNHYLSQSPRLAGWNATEVHYIAKVFLDKTLYLSK